MKLSEFLIHVENETTEIFFSAEHPTLDYDYIEIYMLDEINISSKLHFIDANENEQGLKFTFLNKEFINLFPLHLLIELYEDFKRFYNSNEEIAIRLVQYRINDA